MATIEKETLLFRDLSDEDFAVLREFADRITFEGTILRPLPAIVEEWVTVGGFDENQFLLVVSTVLPSRIYASLLEHVCPST